MYKILLNLLLFLNRKDDIMMAMLWAIEIMKQETTEKAKEVYARVPRLLKEKVKQILIDSGMGELAEWRWQIWKSEQDLRGSYFYANL